MLLETIFYVLGIIVFSLVLIMAIVIAVFVARVRQNIYSFKAGFAGRVMGLLKERNVEVASALGLTVAHFVMDRMKKAMSEKKSSKG